MHGGTPNMDTVQQYILHVWWHAKHGHSSTIHMSRMVAHQTWTHFSNTFVMHGGTPNMDIAQQYILQAKCEHNTVFHKN